MDILEKLQQIADAKVGGPMPEVLGKGEWASPLSQIAKEAVDEITRLRATVNLGQSFSEIKSDIQLAKLQTETEQARVQLLTYQGKLEQYKADVERQVASGKLQVEYYSAMVGADRMLNDGALGRANLQQEVLKSTTQQNIQISEMAISMAAGATTSPNP